jgi:hypothetical protein
MVAQLKKHNQPSDEFDLDKKAPAIDYLDRDHPSLQCRLDTLIAGALCDIPDSQQVTPEDENRGTCNEIQGSVLGRRPRCWYN